MNTEHTPWRAIWLRRGDGSRSARKNGQKSINRTMNQINLTDITNKIYNTFGERGGGESRV